MNSNDANKQKIQHKTPSIAGTQCFGDYEARLMKPILRDGGTKWLHAVLFLYGCRSQFTELPSGIAFNGTGISSLSQKIVQAFLEDYE